MRDAQRLRLTPDEYRAVKARERERTLGALLAELERARHWREPWYVWLLDEWPRLKAPRG